MTGLKPRKPRAYRSPKSHVPRGPRIPTTALTGSDNSTFVYDIENGRTLGCVIALADGGFSAWSTKTRLGEFSSAVAAERAVHKAARAKRAARSKAWEVRS